MKYYFKLSFTLFLFLAVSCEKESVINPDGSNNVQKEKISGYVQKGPFINGTSITISELDADLTPTGKNFNTQISDNKGSFELKQVALSSQFVELKADGFYFNEITGKTSTAQLTLYALSDLTEKSSLNVNIMSHLERGRIDYLVSKGSKFADAKKKAQKEILNIFSINKSDMLESELLDITKDGDDNGILLAISVVIQGYRTDAALSELLANISTDIKEDGVLNSAAMGTKLINHAKQMNLSKVRENLVARYDEMGMAVTVPNFEKYVQLFVDSTDFELTSLIEYPEFSGYGENILFADKSNFKTNTQYSLAANLPVGTELKIILKGGSWFYRAMPNGPINWTISQYDVTQKSQLFKSTSPGEKCDLSLEFYLQNIYVKGDTSGTTEKTSSDSITIEYYENMSDSPTKTKNIIVEYKAPEKK
jgi:hypothetical protein